MKISTRGKTGHGSQRRISVNDKPELMNEREASQKLFQCPVCHVLWKVQHPVPIGFTDTEWKKFLV